MSDNTPHRDFTPPEIEEISALLPAYEIISFIAKGGMGAVYMARQKSLDRIVAIKILPRHFGEDADFRAAFETEAKSMAKLNHPNLIGIYDFGQIDGMLYIIMEMVQGKSLYYSSYGKTIEPTEAARITSEICQGLSNAHKHGILHRDVTPANILLDPSASPKIGDFGLARPTADYETDSAFGTPGYTAPEVIHNPAAVDESTDIYSVGAILYQLLTSKLPDDPYESASSLVGCDPRFDHIIRKAMHPTPAMRYRSAKAMAKALEEITGDKSPENPPLINTTSKPSTSTARNLLTAPTTSKKPTLNTKTGKVPHHKPASSSPPVKIGSNAPFIRNIIIIVALLAAIYVAWEGLKVVRAKRAKQNADIQAINADKKSKRPASPNKSSTSHNKQLPPKTQPLPPKKTKIETPRETLERLQPALARGLRSEMPKGTLTRGNRSRFFIEDCMSWHQAQAFCEKHGGHLAIVAETSELQSLCTKIKPSHTIWLGAGSAGSGEWRWIDGSPWKLDIRRTSKASYVAVDDTAILTPQPATKKHSFFIEWIMDGSTPATLEKQLHRCGQSLETGTPLYPAGSISYDNRQYLLIEHPSDWENARHLASISGGVLSVPSNPDENEWLLNFIASSINKDQSCWIGGLRKPNLSWQWATGEPWTFARWTTGAPNEAPQTPSALAVLPSQTWDDLAIDTRLTHLLIEWSNDHKGHKTVKNTSSKTDKGLGPARKKCSSLIRSIHRKYDKAFTNNIKGYEQELRAYKRALPKSLQEAYGPAIATMASRYPGNRIPKNIPRVNMPEKAVKILDSRLKRQHIIQAKFISEIEILRGKYRKNLSKLSKELKEKGLVSRQRTIDKEIANTNKGAENFIKYITEQ